MFSKSGASAIKADLTNIRELCTRMDNPHRKFKSIHIGGTNGKGSTSHMLAAILQTAGYKTGLYTSPHLRDFRERIRINGEMIPESEVVNFVELQKENIEEVAPSFFEVTVAMAFHHFAKQQVDIAVIEVGLGGRLDSTNIIDPLLSIITNIGYDHMNILGSTLEKIAFEKAGIIKPNVPVVIGEKQDETAAVFMKKAAACNSDLSFASESWNVTTNETAIPVKKIRNLNVTDNLQLTTYSLQLDLTGTYQLKNIKTVLSAVNQLKRIGLKITPGDVETALKQVTALTGLMGRWQTLQEDPLVICDTGHNEDGIREVLRNIRETPHIKLHMVLGMVKDKDISKILALLPREATYYFCSPAMERAKPANELKTQAQCLGLNGESYPTVQDALREAKKNARSGDLIFVGGSTFVVAEVV